VIILQCVFWISQAPPMIVSKNGILFCKPTNDRDENFSFINQLEFNGVSISFEVLLE